MPETAQLSDAKRRLLARYLRGKDENASAGMKLIDRRSKGAIAPLSLSQEELWRRELRGSQIPPLYNECITLRINGTLELAALERSLTEILRRHEIWRTTFETKAGLPVQVVQPPIPVQLLVVDVREFPNSEGESKAIHSVSEAVRKPFRLEKETALRPVLVKINPSEHCLYLVAHQIVLDGVSAYQIFPSELAELYKAFLGGKPSPLPGLPIQFADFACWQRDWLDGEEGKQMEYWEKQLSPTLAVPAWPNDKARSATRTYRGAIRPFAFSEKVSQKLKQFSQRENTTLFSTLLAGFATLLHCYSNQNDIVVGTLSPCGRKRSEVLKLVGYFLNPVALRFDFESDPTFLELLIQARKVMAEAICNDDVPIERLARSLKPGDFSPSPFFRAALSLQPPMPVHDLDWSVTSMDVESGGSPWELYLAFIDSPHGIVGRVQFDPELFDTIAITGMLQDLQRLFEKVIATSQQRLSAVFVA